MQDFNNVEMMELGATPFLGNLLGTGGNALSEYINQMTDRSQFYGTTMDTIGSFRQQFVDKLVTPVKQAGSRISNLIDKIMSEQTIYPVTSFEMLEKVHPDMYIPILTHKPVYDLLKQGRIDGYGINPSVVENYKETYTRLFETNGYADNSVERIVGGGRVFIYHEITSMDPYYTVEEIDAILDTRDFIDDVLKHTPYDPTDSTALRG